MYEAIIQKQCIKSIRLIQWRTKNVRMAFEKVIGGLDQNSWLSVGYIPGDMNTSDGLTKAMSSANMRNLLTRNTFRIVTEWKKQEIRKRCPRINTI